MKESIDIIIAYSNIIIKDLKRETVAIVTQEKKIEFIEKIYEEALNLNSIVGTTLNLSYISLQTLIEESISILKRFHAWYRGLPEKKRYIEFVT